MQPDFHAKKVAILGYGVNNAGLVDYLVRQGADVTICDKNPDLPQTEPNVRYQLGPDYLANLNQFNFLFRTPGLPYLTPEIQAAKNAGATVTSQTELFFQVCQGKIIGVTGTKGKGTTSSLIEAALKAGQKQDDITSEVYLAGNIGLSPMTFVDQVKADDWVILELSSFQLQGLTMSPHIAVVLNITSDHLDHHKDTSEYHDAKKNIVRHQKPEDDLVLFHDSPVTMGFLDATHAQPYFFSRQTEVDLGAYVAGTEIRLKMPGQDEVVVCKTTDLKLFGKYNLENVTAAVVASALAGASVMAIAEGVTSFTGLPHRLQFVAEKNNIKYFDDSYATTPDSSIAAFQAFEEPVTLILGGSSKGADYNGLIEALKTSSVTACMTVGQEGQRLEQLIKGSGVNVTVLPGASTMTEIVQQATEATQPGGIVLLSPAAASFDMFKNVKDRGEQFQVAVNNL